MTQSLIRLRIDVDYPYPSRFRSFIYTALGIKMGRGYLKNSKIIAQMINTSLKEVKACWFFTLRTIPDKELLKLLVNTKHEIALHIINDPKSELKLLEELTERKIEYYTIHGTARLFARIMWKRWKTKVPKIPSGFPLQSFHHLPTVGVDVLCHIYNTDQSFRIVKSYIEKRHVLHFHPIWLFQQGKLNQRGSFYETLEKILEVNEELEALELRKKILFTIANDAKEYERDVVLTEELFKKLKERGIDVFTFIERGWHYTIAEPSSWWIKEKDNIGLLHVKSYEGWWRNVGKKTRNMVRKAERNGIKTKIVEPSERLAKGIWKVYNETPIRQERRFPHYGTLLETVKKSVLSSQNCTYIGAYLQDELVGFIQLVHGSNIIIMSQILSLQKHWDKAVNNALIAKAIEVNANMGIKWLMYGRMGNHPKLDNFKRNNGFVQFPLIRYYIPLTKKGRIAIKLGLHIEIKNVLPTSIKHLLIPIYNWISKYKTKTKLFLRPKETP